MRSISMGRWRAVLAALVLPIPLAACPAGLSPSSPVTMASNDTAATLDTAVKALTLADSAATFYAELPLCGPSQAMPCSSAAVVAKIKTDAGTARLDLEQAQAGQASVATALAALDTINADITAVK